MAQLIRKNQLVQFNELPQFLTANKQRYWPVAVACERPLLAESCFPRLAADGRKAPRREIAFLADPGACDSGCSSGSEPDIKRMRFVFKGIQAFIR